MNRGIESKEEQKIGKKSIKGLARTKPKLFGRSSERGTF
jgi:hypothetical protein